MPQIWAQLGSGSVFSLITLVGGYVGAAAYGMIHDTVLWQSFLAIGTLRKVRAFIVLDDTQGDGQASCLCWYAFLVSQHSAFEYVNTSRVVAACGMMVIMAVVIALLEAFTPNHHKVPLHHNWNPILAGAVVGALQLPLFTLLSKNMGSSSSFVTVASNILFLTRDRFHYLAKFRPGFINWWQVLYVAFAAVGALLARLSSPGQASYDASKDGLSAAESFVGGFLIIFGARIAAGCTSGHGITGMAHLSIRSMVAVSHLLRRLCDHAFLFKFMCRS
jgi:uncharacterized protein